MKTANVRKAMFAGSWYPASAAECEKDINRFLEEGQNIQSPERRLVGGIVPHAGWYFSGSIACNVISRLKGKDTPDVIVVFGMHLHPDSPCYLMAEGAWETPFGEIPVEDRLAAALVKKHSFSLETPDRFNRDNTVELQLPFIKYFFEDAKIVALGVPPSPGSSTDLTHYGSNYGFTSRGRGKQAVDWVRNENDRRVIDAMLALEPGTVISEALASQNACCAGAAATAIEAAKNLGANQADEIAYATSYDKSPGDSFVGYVGIVMSARAGR
jgi:predicted class III extradiol MEMO1 family dioxygenase